MIENESEKINLYISYPGEFVGSKDQQKDFITLDINQTLNEAFKYFANEKNLKIKGSYYFYLIENDELLKELPKDVIILELGINSKDNILVTDKILQIKDDYTTNYLMTLLSLKENKLLTENNPKKKIRSIKNALPQNKNILINNILPKKKNRSIKNIEKPNYSATSKDTNTKYIETKEVGDEMVNNQKKKNSYIILIIIIVIIGLAGLSTGLVFILKHFLKKKPNKIEIVYTEEKLVADIYYQPDILFRYSNKKNSTMTVEGEAINTSQTVNTNHMEQIIDFFFLIRTKNIEYDNITFVKKNWYTGYLCILNMSFNNGTNDMMVVYDGNMYKYLKSSNFKNLSEKDLNYLDENGKLCFVKFEFYENGNVKNIYLPDKFNLNNTEIIKEIIKLLIPKISSNLYQENINDTLKEIYDKINKEDNDDIYENETINEDEYENDTIDENDKDENDSTNENDDDENEIRLRRIYIIKNLPQSSKLLRKLTENESSIFENETFCNDSSEIIIEEYLTTPSSESLNYDLREVNNYLNDSNLNQTNNCTNLTEYSIQNIECNETKMENSLLNTSIYTKINENGILEFITELKNGILNNQKYIDNDEENNQTFPESLDETNMEDNDENENIFNITSLSLSSINFIELIEYYSNETLNEKLYKYFDSFTYKIYNNENETNDKNLRLLKEKKEEFMKLNNLNEDDITIEYVNETKKRKRKLDDDYNSNSNSYYGMKNINYNKNLYNHNLLGLKMNKKIYNELDPSTGKSSTYFISTFGNENQKFKVKEKQTNLHLILKNKNQMAFTFINLLYQSYVNLNEQNKNYVDVIIQMEKNITNFLKGDYDISDIMRGSMNDLYDQVKNFTGEFFIELIQLINNTYDNYTIILNNIKNEKYDAFNQIRNVTKYVYINYINNMINILEIFYNNTIIFLDDIEKELIYINYFQIDVLYDIIESLYDGKLIIKQFNKKLYKSIEKGILTFRYDIRDYINEIIGDLLYITDFLSVNINKNEILKQAIDEKIRNEISIKLKSFRNIVITIFDLLITNINKDYNTEMSVNNKNSIKSLSENNSKTFLNNIEKNSDDLINKIKLKIKYISLYELYSDNINNINNIQNKTFIEYINDTYNNLLLNLSNLHPDYLDNNSNIIKIKQKLYKISKNITNNLNEEIKEINEYIVNYIDKYKEENAYSMYYNLYYFKKVFNDKEMENLLNQFNLLLNNTIKVHFKEKIDYNFNLANQVFDEEYRLLIKNKGYKRRFIGKGFLKRYYQYKSKFETFLVLTYSEEFLNLLEKYFNKIRNDIINNINNRINKINKYYFNKEKNQNDFYFLDQINNEIFKIIDNINNYYNEINLDTKIKIKAINLSNDILSPYHKNKINNLDKYYKKIYSKTNSYHIRNTNSDFVRSRWRTFKGWKNNYFYCKHTKNINKVLVDLSQTDKYLSKESNNIINNFIKKFDNYLNNYIILNQKLYYNLFIYVDNKINNNEKIELFSLDYNNLYNELLNKDSNFAIYQKISLIDFKVEIFMKNLENNVNLIKDNYFNIYYLNNNSDFLEYPEEIIYKINQFTKELSKITEYMKEKINNVLKKKITNIINLTNIFIKDFNSFNLEYVLTHINIYDIYEEYISSKFKLINQIFINFTNVLDIKYKEYNNTKLNDFFQKENYNKLSNDTINNYKNFVLYFENIIIQNFTIKNCTKILVDNNTYINENNETIENNTYNETCETKIKQSELNYSKYNFNIVKLRNGIYYTKNLIENLENIFDELNYDNIIDINQIKEKDKLLNNKNILNIYNDSLNKLQFINKESLSILSENYENYMEDFKNKFSYEQDYLPFIEKFKKIITFKDENYNNYTNDNINKIQNNINIILNDFKNTLNKQLTYTKNYNFYNFNATNFEKVFTDYNSLINDSFYQYKYNIDFLDKRILFNNSIIKILENLQFKKRNYYNKIINDFSKNYDFELFNISYNLGEKSNLYMKKIYNDYIFNNIYDYVELFENYSNNYKKYIHSLINDLEINTKNKLKIIYENFYETFNKSSSKFVNYKYIEDLKTNYTNCINYSDDILNETIKKDLISYEKYKNYTNLINYIKTKCSNNYTISLYNNSEGNITIDNNKTNYTNAIQYECLLNISEIQVIEYFNETEHLLNCHNNNYYNYSVKFFEDFNEYDKNKMENLIKNITNIIQNNYINEEFLYNYLQNYKLPNYDNVSINDLYNDFTDIENMINYVNYIKKDEYKNFLYNSLVISFNDSYQNFINNYIIDELIDNITILIDDKIEFLIIYIQNKIIDEYNYYLLILNQTNEVGYTSKNSLINLYEVLKSKLNESLYFLIESDINFYLTILYKENKNLFIDNYYSYIKEDKEDLSVFKLYDYLEEIIVEKDLNKSLIDISSNLLNKNIIEKIKIRLKILIEEKINKIFNLCDIVKDNITKILNNKTSIELNEDMYNISKKIQNYNEYINNFTKRFNFTVGKITFDILYEFVKDVLEPPLILIKDKYNSIEEKLLEKIFKIVDNFPDFLEVVKNKIKSDNFLVDIDTYKSLLNTSFIEYINAFKNDLDNYLNKLVHFIYINGLNSYDKPCNESYCMINIKNISTRKLDENNYNKKRKININNNIKNIKRNNKIYLKRNNKIYLKRKLTLYNSTSGKIAKEDVVSCLSYIKDVLNNFNSSYLSTDYKSIKRELKNYIIKINYTSLYKLKRSISMFALKFSTILTEENYQKMQNIIYKQYNNIEHYINNNTDFINLYVNDFSNTLNDTSLLLYFLYVLSFNNTIEYYDRFNYLIQNKLKYILENETEEYNFRQMTSKEKVRYGSNKKELKYKKIRNASDSMLNNEDSFYANGFIEIKNDAQNIFQNMKEIQKNGIFTTIEKLQEKIFIEQEIKRSKNINARRMDNPLDDVSIDGEMSMESEWFKNITGLDIEGTISYGKNFEYNEIIVFKFPSFPSLQLRIKPYFFLGYNLDLGYEYKEKGKENIIFMGMYGKAEVKISFEVGLYIPESIYPIEITINIGINGVIGSGIIGWKLSCNLSTSKFILNEYVKTKAYLFTFYIRMGIEVNIGIPFSFYFYIYKKKLFGDSYEKQKSTNDTEKITYFVSTYIFLLFTTIAIDIV